MNSTKNYFYDDNEEEKTEQEIGENENESSIDEHSSNTNVMRIPEINDRRVARGEQETRKKSNPQTATGYEQKTSKHAPMRREKW